jgi:ATP-dependent 26S proteasome regulatory subunit
MDGFDSANNITVIAATNMEDRLDPALTRSGRFDLKIRISLPYF